jgi:Ni,Fe-hydrogenase III small subunit
MAQALAPAVALAILLVVTMILESTAPTTVVHSHVSDGEDCYCHKGLVAPVLINGTDLIKFSPRVMGGASFTLIVQAVFFSYASYGTIASTPPNSLAWTADMGDNAKFTFDPGEVVDGSPQDQDPASASIRALFRITAPNRTGSYSVVLSYPMDISEIPVTVGGPSSASYAVITRVDGPLVARTGEIVRVNVTLQNNGTEPSTFYVYATNSSAKQLIFAKVYSQAPVAGNQTTVLNVEFKMPNGSLTLTIHSGHVESSSEIDDGQFTVYLFQSLPAPPVQTASFNVLAVEWAPWIVIIAASLGSVPLVGMYARGGKRLLPEGGSLKFVVVECAGCSICKNAVKDLGKAALNLSPRKVDLTSNLMTAEKDGHVDVALVVGSIRTEKDVRAVKEAREKAKVLVAFGACSAFGELAASDRRRVDAVARGLRKPIALEELSQRTIETKPLSEYVKVDLTIPGCPPQLETIRYAIEPIQSGIS